MAPRFVGPAVSTAVAGSRPATSRPGTSRTSARWWERRRARGLRPGTIGAFGAVALVGGCCCPPSPPDSTVTAAPLPATSGPLPVPAPVAEAEDSVVQMRLRNVHLHLAQDVVLRIEHMRGQMLGRHGPGRPPVLGDPESYVVRLDTARVAMDMASLARLMNRVVFGYDGAPLRGMTFQTVGDRLRMRGVMHKGVDVPFTITSSVAITPEGHIRIHPEDMDICGIDGDGFLRALGLQLADLLDVSRAVGIRAQGNDLVLDPSRALPPPLLEGRLTSIRVAEGVLVQSFSHAARPGAYAPPEPLVPPDTTVENFLFFLGGTLRFGKLYMVQADLMIVDGDPRDMFEFSGTNFDPQLVAGYSRTLVDAGLMAVVPDLDDLPEAAMRPPPLPDPARPGRR